MSAEVDLLRTAACNRDLYARVVVEELLEGVSVDDSILQEHLGYYVRYRGQVEEILEEHDE